MILKYYDSSWIKNPIFRNNCLIWLSTQVQDLSELFIKQRGLGKGKSSIFALYCFTFFQSQIFEDVIQKNWLRSRTGTIVIQIQSLERLCIQGILWRQRCEKSCNTNCRLPLLFPWTTIPWLNDQYEFSCPRTSSIKCTSRVFKWCSLLPKSVKSSFISVQVK